MISHAAEDLVDALYKEIARQNTEIERLRKELAEYVRADVAEFQRAEKLADEETAPPVRPPTNTKLS
jgi:uncharacterized coiled-coil protein SlyX